MTDLYLVRHGETDWNLARRIQGLTDIPLNSTGRGQARLTGRLLARRPIDGIYASPLERARETAQLIAAETGLGEPVLVDAIIERNYGEAEGMTFRQIERRYPRGADVPGRESREEVAARVVPALRELAARHRDGSVVVVSHGGAIRAALMAADPAGAFGPIPNGSVHSFHVDRDDLHLIAFDDPIELASIDLRGGSLDAQNAVEAHEPPPPDAA